MKKYLFLTLLFLLSCSGDNPVDSSIASLSITSSPDNALVKLNGVSQGNTPITISDLEPAVYTVQLEKEGYEIFEEEVDMSSGGNYTKHYELLIYTGTLSIVTLDPDNANVFIDGFFVGFTPLFPPAPFPVGTFTIELQGISLFTDYFPIFDEFTVNRNQETNLVYDLTQIPDIGAFGTATDIDTAGNITGASETFSNIKKVWFYFELNFTNRDDWQLKYIWYRGETVIKEYDWTSLIPVGTVQKFWGSHEVQNTFLPGDYKIELIVRENDYANLFHVISFTVTQ